MRSINTRVTRPAVFQPLAIRPPKGAGVFATEFSRLVSLESRIASPVASIGGQDQGVIPRYPRAIDCRTRDVTGYVGSVKLRFLRYQFELISHSNELGK